MWGRAKPSWWRVGRHPLLCEGSRHNGMPSPDMGSWMGHRTKRKFHDAFQEEFSTLYLFSVSICIKITSVIPSFFQVCWEILEGVDQWSTSHSIKSSTTGFMGWGKEETHVLFSPPYSTYTILDMQYDDGHTSAQPPPSRCAASVLLQGPCISATPGRWFDRPPPKPPVCNQVWCFLMFFSWHWGYKMQIFEISQHPAHGCHSSRWMWSSVRARIALNKAIMTAMCNLKQVTHLDLWNPSVTERNVYGGTLAFGKIKMENSHVYKIPAN